MPNPTNNGTAIKMAKDIQTPKPNEETGEETEEKPLTEDSEEKGTVAKEGKEETEAWKKKFADSFRETERYRKQVIPDLEDKYEREKQAREALEKDQQEFLKTLEEENPEGKRLIELQKQVKELRQDALLGKEAREINDFIEANPKTKDMKGILQSLGRAHPGESYEDLWDKRLLPTLENYLGKVETKEEVSKTPETGKGEISKAPETEIDLKAFRKLSLEKRRKILKKALGER